MSLSVEAIIQAAVQRGELDDLPYRGQRLPLDDDSGTHPEDRMSHRVLRNAGMVPAEVATMREIAQLRQALTETTDAAEKKRIGIQAAQKESAFRIRIEHNARR